MTSFQTMQPHFIITMSTDLNILFVQLNIAMFVGFQFGKHAPKILQLINLQLLLITVVKLSKGAY